MVSAGIPPARLYSMCTNDLARFDALLPFLHAPWFAVLAIIAVFFLIANIIGYAAAGTGVGIISLSVLIQVRLAFRFRALRARTAKKTDERIHLLDEICAAILTIKANSWEEEFYQRVELLRKAEMRTILKSQLCKALNSGLYFCSVTLALFFTFAVLYLLDADQSLPSGKGLKLGDVASIIALLNALRQIISFGCAYFMMAFPEVLVALKRLEYFFNIPNVDTPYSQSRSPTLNERTTLISLVNASLAWPAPPDDSIQQIETKNDVEMPLRDSSFGKNKIVLKEINLQIKPGDFICICGPVGAGKTSLILGMLGELDLVHGNLDVYTRIAYAAQSPWLVTGTLRSNIAASNEQTLDKALYACDLVTDLQVLPGGKDCLLGDRGVTLSGGQKARVSLARVIAAVLDQNDYEPILVVLDDVFAALDNRVANTVVQRTISILRNARQGMVSVVLATHAKSLAKIADKLVILSASGNVLASGTYQHVLGCSEAVPYISESYGSDEATIQLAEESQVISNQEKNAPTRKNTTNPAVAALAEERESGDVSNETVMMYVRGAGCLVVSLVTLSFIIGQVLLLLSDAYLLRWSTSSRKSQRKPQRLYVFAILASATVFVAITRAMAFYTVAMRCAAALHRKCVRSIIFAPLWFHDGTPRGRILTRVSSDVGHVDELLPQALFDLFQLGFLMLSIIIIACVAVPILVCIIPIAGIVFIRLKIFTSKSMTALKRLDQSTRSPVVERFAATVDGLASIRAFGSEEKAINLMADALDLNGRSWFWWLISQRYLGFFLDSGCVLFLSLLVLLAFTFKATNINLISPELIALALLYAMQLAGNFQWCVRQLALAQSLFSSVERLVHYGKLPTEPEVSEPEVHDSEWPQSATLEFVDLRVRYRTDLPDVLKGISISFPAGSTVGVCGRTGSGKSSFALAIARLNIISNGKILLDGLDTSKVPLKRLRKQIAIIPQDPIIFTGTVHFNIDPLSEKSKADALRVLQAVGLSTERSDTYHNSSNILDRLVDESSSNISQGERQLICLARALLLERKICTLDEATASTDSQTDQRIQEQLKKATFLNEATTFIIAHRLATIEHADNILILDNGIIREHGSPEELASDPNSAFTAMRSAAKLQPSASLSKLSIFSGSDDTN
eukprot:CAMPEP_0197289596 /NCGR_PEP_ID=MMETSP0890-20130614/6851_1 /TAXON_ID=44058 ORGANISM="Aureoumbra lagunensis, Strain CCMP1510" /NCGR_SAMPLE_ID=MMETSP0890 /ASSEMBLY_ACC=CAM_ASM_000533 /LENGTH=1141 /DNA_ID=CAMNT_0042761093 /DNA_START=552 /DNA_END=3977 /DNA_ORIENTATION=-